MKTEKKIYLEDEDLKQLELKAKALGFIGRGWLNSYLSKLANEPIVFLDGNTRTLLQALNLNSN